MRVNELSVAWVDKPLTSKLDMGILSYKFLLRQDDNENFFVATITTKKTITTMKNLDQNSTKKGSFCVLLI